MGAVPYRDFAAIPLRLPERRILMRLRFHSRMTVVPDDQMAEVGRLIREAAAVCEPRGRAVVLAANVGAETVVIDGIGRVPSVKLAKLLADSRRVVVMAATVGPAVVDAVRERSDAGRMTEAVIFDAVGAEMADAAVNYLHELFRHELRRTGHHVTRRFSPGYGDVRLDVQKQIHTALALDELGLRLSERFMLIPEKSVTAIAGIEEIT